MANPRVREHERARDDEDAGEREEDAAGAAHDRSSLSSVDEQAPAR
jgi:hypothetical protein